MNIKNLLIIFRKNLKFNRRKIITTIIMIFILVLIFVVVAFNDTILTYIYNLSNNSYYMRTLYIADVSDEAIEDIANIEHVVAVNIWTQTSITTKNEEYEQITLYPVDENTLPIVVSGSNLLVDNNIICPVDFIPSKGVDWDYSVTTEAKIDGTTLIGKTITTNFSSISGTYTDSFTIVGVYDSQKYMMENNACFISYDDFNYLYQTINGVSNLGSNYAILIDDYKNIDEVASTISDMGYDAGVLVFLDYDFLYLSWYISFISLIVFLVIIYILINFNIKKELTQKENEILLYKSIGYNKKDILKIYYLDNMFIYFIATIISIIVSLIVGFIVKTILNNYAIFHLLKVRFGLIEVLIVIFFGLIYSSILVIFKTKRIVNKERIKL